MKYSYISRRFVSDSTYKDEQESMPFIFGFLIIIFFCIWVYGNFINPIIKIEIEEKTEIVYSKKDYVKTTEINGISCSGFECNRIGVQNILIGDSIKIKVENFYKKSGDIYTNKTIIKKL